MSGERTSTPELPPRTHPGARLRRMGGGILAFAVAPTIFLAGCESGPNAVVDEAPHGGVYAVLPPVAPERTHNYDIQLAFLKNGTELTLKCSVGAYDEVIIDSGEYKGRTTDDSPASLTKPGTTGLRPLGSSNFPALDVCPQAVPPTPSN